MRTKTKRLSVLLLSAGMAVSAVGAAVFFHQSGIAHADNARGMAVKYEADHELQGGAGLRSTYWDSGQSQMRIDFTFENAPAASTIFIEDMTNNVAKNNIGDHVLFDGKAISSMTGSFDWWALGGSFGGYALGFCSNKPDNPLKTLKELTIKQGFTWLTVPTPGAWGKGTDMSTCSPCEGATLAEDVVLWNGGANGWLRRASDFEVTADNVSMMLGKEFDASQIKAKATLLDGTKVDIDSAWLDISFDKTSAGKKTATVTYQDLAEKTVEITVVEPERVLRSLEVTGADHLTAKQFEAPDLSGVTVKANYEDGSQRTLTATDYTVEIDTWTKGTVTGKISYTDLGFTKEAEISVTVGEPDLSKGMEIGYDGISVIVPNTGMMQFKATFEGVEQFEQNVNILSTDRLTGSHIADFVKIKIDNEERTIAEWRENNVRINVGVYNSGNFVLEVTEPVGTAIHSRVQKVTFLPGFQWVTSIDNGDHMLYDQKDGEVDTVFRNVDGAVLKKEVAVWKGADGWETAATRIEAEYKGEAVAKGGALDYSKIEVTAHFADGSSKKIPVTPDMLSKTSFNETGTQTVVVTYQDRTAEIGIPVTDETLMGMRITKMPDVLNYEVGDWKVDLKGIEVELTYRDSAGLERTEKLLDAAKKLSVAELDSYQPAESKQITVTYQALTATFPITIAPSTRGGITVDWQSGGGFTPEKQSPNLTISFSIADVNISTIKAIKLRGNEDHVLDCIEINGRPAKEWLGHGLAWVGFYGQELTLTFQGTELVWGTESNGATDGSNDPNSYYVAGESTVVETVKLLKGLTWYTSADGDDKWRDLEDSDRFEKVPHAILSEDVLLINDDGHGWMRMLKQEDGDVAEDAIEIVSMPVKTTFKVGEKLNPAGLKLCLRYEDGGEETVNIVAADITGYDSKKVGKQTLTVDLYGKAYYVATIEVTVTDAETEEGGEQKGGCGSALSAGAGMLAAAAFAAVALFRRKRKD